MLNLRNEFIFAPVKTGYSDNTGVVKQKHLDFYRERSQGVGAVTPEPFYLDKGLRELPTQMGIDSDDKVPGLKQLTEVIHQQGAKAIAHLSHPGRMANPGIPGNYYISATDRPCENGGAEPRRMEKADLENVTEQFVSAAQRAVRAGFDIIELQFGHGYLFAQFLSPFVNDREDEYGGSFENRMRFPVEVLDRVKQVGLPVIVRISGDEMVPGGITLDEMRRFSLLLDNHGAEAIHVSAGTVCTTPPWFFQHMFTAKGKTWDMAQKIKEDVTIPVIGVGRINSRHDVDYIKSNYSFDYLALGRALVADPHFVEKYYDEAKGIIRPCLACSEGCLGGVKSGKGLQCVVNPTVGKDKEDEIPLKEPAKYAIAGGGLAGMQAALTIKQRGHDVTLYEENQLGGQFNLAHLPPKKDNLKELLDYFKEEIQSNEIKVVQKRFEPKEVEKHPYDGVILATGSKPLIPEIKGLDKYYWADFLLDENLPEKEKILIIGGGLIGVEMASKLLDKDNEVILVEMLNDLAQGMEMIEKKMTMNKLMNSPSLRIYKTWTVTRVDGDKVILQGDGEKTIDGVDKIVVAAGMRPYNPLQEKLKGKVKTWTVGDARKVGKAREAISSAYTLGKSL